MRTMNFIMDFISFFSQNIGNTKKQCYFAEKRSMYTRYQYENLDETEFENLVIAICQNILGVGCKTFSVGKDGGKDSWFSGTAQNYPSTTAPWSGIFIIQAKHTASSEASCSDNNFHGNRTSIISKEILRLQDIQKDDPFDNYLIFTNRKLAGGEHPKIRRTLISGLGINNVEIFGKEEFDTFLEISPSIVQRFGLHKFNMPERFYEKDIQDVILLFDDMNNIFDTNFSQEGNMLLNIDKREKNILNNLSNEYFQFILDQSLAYFTEIESFLKDPKNRKYNLKYRNTVSDLQAFIIQNREKFLSFMDIIEYIVKCIVGLDREDILERRSLVRIFVHFMYFNCDIGKTK